MAQDSTFSADRNVPHRVRQMEFVISGLLRTGVIISLFVVVFGTALSFVRHPSYRSMPEELERLTSPGAGFPGSLREVWGGLRQFRGRAITIAGLLLLIATPVLRVAVSVVAFIYERDYVFVVITMLVLTLLLLSFALGKAGG